MSACIERRPKGAQEAGLLTAYRFTFCRISKSRPKLAPSAWVSSSSSCGSGTRSWLVGRWGSAGRRAPSAAAWWWTRSSWIHPLALPAEVWNRVYASFWSECASGTTGLRGGGGAAEEEEEEAEEEEEGAYNGLVTTVAKSRSPPRLWGAYRGTSGPREAWGILSLYTECI